MNSVDDAYMRLALFRDANSGDAEQGFTGNLLRSLGTGRIDSHHDRSNRRGYYWFCL